ncbi:DEAD/DEAH box helicase [Curvivirga sp.]|uniref:DEAD/DEAH box helicase n=1 Tax=Curvivirga sp. TaxID=2856848 RepID=UPI003B5A5A70
MYLKEYQKATLTSLQKYLELCRLYGAQQAYEEVVSEPAQKLRLGRYVSKYKVLNSNPDTPYVCLRLPTGAGKTILATRSIGIAQDAWLEQDYPTVLWLVPSNPIRTQTVEALKKPTHPYRQQLDELYSGRVRVFDITDFNQIRPQDIRDNLTVIVGTIQTLRVSNTEGRKVYAHHEDMEPHFSSVPSTTEGLERMEEGGVKFSFANLLHLVRPIMIVDEAHNAVTGLSREMQSRVNPSCIIEFTATPRNNSNILHSVTAQEVKDEEMIKLPVVLTAHQNWQAAVDGAVQRRSELEAVASKDKSYIRPIVLLQAQKKNEEVNVDVLKQYLVEDSGIAEEKIAIATGDQRELDGINLFDPKCPIEYVITVEALKEGWDCSFAYVFCSVANIRSAGAVEQLLGRVMRMPYAAKRKSIELNKAYAHLSSDDFLKTAHDLKDKLVEMGFDEQEANASIEIERRDEGQLPLEEGLFAPSVKPKPEIVETASEAPDLEDLDEEDRLAIDVERRGDGEVVIKVKGHVSEAAISKIKKALPTEKQQDFDDKLKSHKAEVAKLAAASRRVPFRVPKLLVHIQDELELADPEIFDEYFEWSLLDHSCTFDAGQFTVKEKAETYEIDLDGNKISVTYADRCEQLGLDVDVDNWTTTGLVLAIDKKVSDPRFGQSERVEWIRKHIDDLLDNQSIPLNILWRAKFVLARELSAKIKALKEQAATQSHQKFLLDPEAKPDIDFSQVFEFKDRMYDGQAAYKGSFKFPKHYLDLVPAFDGNETGEEFRCAAAIERLPEVKHWIRNIPNHQMSFRLPLAQGWTYPDFVAELNDGRILVVEYKGDHLLQNDDTKQKRLVGEIWERSMKGKGLYLMAVKDDDGKDVSEQLELKVS